MRRHNDMIEHSFHRIPPPLLQAPPNASLCANSVLCRETIKPKAPPTMEHPHQEIRNVYAKRRA